MSRYAMLVTALAVIIPLDQLTKFFIDSRFRIGESVTVLENFFHITYVRNPGAAFGILADSSVRIPFFITVTVVASFGILFYLRRLRDDQRLLQFSLCIILAGALGNLIDRVRFGEVVDFLDFHWYEHHWPAFNVADSAITVGVCLMLLDLFLEEKRKKASGDPPDF